MKKEQKTKNQLTKKKGFTLIELILFMGLFSIILFILTDTFVSVVNTKLTSESSTATVQDGTFVLSRIIYDIERASSITSPGAPGATSASLQLVIGGINYTYALSGGNLTLTNNTGTNRLNSVGTTVSNFSATRVGNIGGKNTLRLSFRLTSTTVSKAGGPTVKDFQTTVGTR